MRVSGDGRPTVAAVWQDIHGEADAGAGHAPRGPAARRPPAGRGRGAAAAAAATRVAGVTRWRTADTPLLQLLQHLWWPTDELTRSTDATESACRTSCFRGD